MNEARRRQVSVVEKFRALHASGCFLLPNPWDAGTAIFLEHLGFEALTSTSAGVSFTRGRPDTIEAISRDEMLAHFRDLVNATRLPQEA